MAAAAAGERQQCAALLLMCWLLGGLLLPTMLLLPREPGPEPEQQGPRRPLAAAASAVGATLEGWLRMLLYGTPPAPPDPETDSEEEGEEEGGSVFHLLGSMGIPWWLRWWGVLVTIWAVSCAASPQLV